MFASEKHSSLSCRIRLRDRYLMAIAINNYPPYCTLKNISMYLFWGGFVERKSNLSSTTKCDQNHS
jgi:hypothetical protein